MSTVLRTAAEDYHDCGVPQSKWFLTTAVRVMPIAWRRALERKQSDMEPIPHESLVRWTARGFVACYYLRYVLGGSASFTRSPQVAARRAWTVGCALCLIHFAAAFWLVHGGSHDQAYESVARRTAEMTGWSSGVGLYINYLFGLLWLADTILWWIAPRWHDRPGIAWPLHGFFAFLILQSTVVFGPGYWIPLTIPAVILLVVQARNPGRPARDSPQTR